MDSADTGTPSYAKLISGYDGSDHAVDGLALAELLTDVTGGGLLVATVVPHEFPYAPGTAEREQLLRSQAQDKLVDAVAESDRVNTRVVAARSAAQGLHSLAGTEEADALVVGSSHRGPVGRVLAGSVAERLLHGAPCPVAVAPAGYRERPDRRLRVVGCAFDGSDEAQLAARHAAYLVRRVLLGGVSSGLVRSSPAPVLVVPRGADCAPLGAQRRSSAPALTSS